MPSKGTEKNVIQIQGARVHNLKNVNLLIPRNKFIVITGISGSGKSSLAFDTLYAEGQRRYVESLSSYARQFLGRINKPEVDFIKGIPPAIAIEQKVNTRNPRSTVGTSTEIYDFIKLLFARIGKTYSPISGKLVKRHSVSDVVNFMQSFSGGTKAMIMCPVNSINERTLQQQLDILQKQGFSRVEINLLPSHLLYEKISKRFQSGDYKIDEIIHDTELLEALESINLIIDRVVISDDDDTLSRIADSAQTAFYEGHGVCTIRVYNQNEIVVESFSNKFEADGIEFEDPTIHTFSFNNPVGACRSCEGFGMVMGIDEDLVIPDKKLSIYEGAIACWKGDKMSWWNNQLIDAAQKSDIPVHTPFYKLTSSQRKTIWDGNKHFQGLTDFFKEVEEQIYKIQYRVMLSRYRGKTTCPECNGTRLKKQASYVKVNDKSIHELVLMPVAELSHFFNHLIELNEYEQKVAKRILTEIQNRLRFLDEVGLGYLTLNRLSSTLSGGESQRINLATSLGSSLVGSLYILDEPSIGLHSRDTNRLIKVLRQLRNLGNTVVVVEHDEEIIRAAEEIIDVGQFAGSQGGEIVFHGVHSVLLSEAKNPKSKSLTAKYLTGVEKIETPKVHRKWSKYIEIKGARENNLKSVDAKFPLGVLTVVTGVSGSGKSSLVSKILYPALAKYFNGYAEKTGKHDAIDGDVRSISGVEFVNQNPIGKSTRSNPATYIKVYDEIRKLYSSQKAATVNGLKPSDFSFNVEGGRCEECQGEGEIKVEMQFMADVHLVCESCNGQRFREEVLEIKYRECNIFDVLEMTIDDAIIFFGEEKNSLNNRIVQKLNLLSSVGLGYVKLGQSSSTLSGGESQRIKLASFLGQEKQNETLLFIFDEPTTGLHFHDIKKLLKAFNELINKGNTIVVIEHNLDVIKSADWIIDMGKEGGDKGGNIVFEGVVEDLAQCTDSYTGYYLQQKLEMEKTFV